MTDGRFELDSDREVSLGDAKAWLRARLDDGAECPCCGQRAQMYRRAPSSAACHVLIRAARAYGTRPFHLPSNDDWSRAGGEFARLRYWRLVEEDRTQHDDYHAGWWRITALGIDFVGGAYRVPKYARVYNGEVYGYEGKDVDIRSCLGRRYNYEVLMRGWRSEAPTT